MSAGTRPGWDGARFEPRPPGLGVSALAPPPADRTALGVGFGAYSSYRRAGETGPNQLVSSSTDTFISWYVLAGFRFQEDSYIGALVCPGM